MDEAVNYRMKLVIDPKNVVKANRELRAMERYFERIQGRVMKIGRTRMVPEIMIRDYASKQIDGVLGKLRQLKSQRLNVTMKSVKANDAGQSSNNAFGQLIVAVQNNTTAVSSLTSSLGQTAPAAEAKPKRWYEKTAGFFNEVKTFGGTVKSGATTFENVKNFKTKYLTDAANGNAPKTGWKKAVGLATGIGEVVSGVGETGAGLSNTLGKWGTGIFDFITDAGNSGIVGSILPKAKKLIGGPIGTALDAASIITAGSDKERAQAIGSTAGGAIGATIGGAVGTLIPIPGVGTAVGSFLGGMAGDFVGGKIGGLISDHGPAIKENASKAISWVSEKATSVGQGVMNAGKNLLGAGANIGSKVTGWITDKAPTVKEGASKAVGWASQKVSDAGKGALAFGKNLWGTGTNALNKAKGWAADKASTVKEGASKAVGWASQKASDAGKGILTFGKNLLGAGANVINKAKGWATDKATTVKEGASKAVGWASQKASDSSKGMLAFGKNLFGAGVNVINKAKGWAADKGPAVKEGASKAVGWASNKATNLGDGISNLLNFSKKGVSSSLSWLFDKLNPLTAAKNTISALTIAGSTPKTMSSATKGKNPQAAQPVQISPEQMGQISGYLQNFKKDTINNVSVNFPAGAVQMNVHENAIDIGAIVSQVAARLDAELRKAQQNRKPALP
ncbi:hypothetical protein [Paenibacillus massiliensis]|uniref:hypothetical protein n=1 Tax=Paenibacillus massiliensis TaxID=225917 RepID=UPI00042A73C3|nr:hypothetical protein [Paenibacillus massiliensis]